MLWPMACIGDNEYVCLLRLPEYRAERPETRSEDLLFSVSYRHMAEYQQWKDEHPGEVLTGNVWHHLSPSTPGELDMPFAQAAPIHIRTAIALS